MDTIEKKSVATIRTLSIDAIEKANSVTQGCQWGPLQWHTRCGQNL